MSITESPHRVTSTVLERKARLFELALEAVEQGAERFDSEALLFRRLPDERRPGLSVVQQSPEYAIALIETSHDVELGLRIIDRVLDYQLTDKSRYDYGNWRWMHEWDRAKDPNAVSFMMAHLGYFWSHHRNKCTGPLRKRLQDAAALAGHALLGHRCQWSYTNIFLKNILAKFYVADMADDRRMREIAYWDWAEWYCYTERFGFTEYNSPTYTGTQLRCLEMIAELDSIDKSIRDQVHRMLELLYGELLDNYHTPSDRITGPMLRCYEPAQLPTGHDHTTAGFLYRQLGGCEPLPRTTLVHCAQSDYILPDEVLKIATDKKYPHRSCIHSPFTGDIRTNYQTKLFAIGSKTGGHNGISEVPLYISWVDGNPRRTFYVRTKPKGSVHFAAQVDHRVLGAFRIEKTDAEATRTIHPSLPIGVGGRTDLVPPSVDCMHVQFFLGPAQAIKPGPIPPNTPVTWTAGPVIIRWQWLPRHGDAINARLIEIEGEPVIDVCFNVHKCLGRFGAFTYAMMIHAQTHAAEPNENICEADITESGWHLNAVLDNQAMELDVPLPNLEDKA